ncbi:hypothetical protein HDK90DRAFT_193233 [Phyllosticta capitalensis]|uniref:Uncharacterized protein n=1 Tax=Phyllosticta capitalensis TaxID=121624 RepID=A0ABR1YXZ6_9PEZI
MGNPSDVTLRLPPHIQKQLANMACSPPPRTPSGAPPSSQYHAALASQYRQRIQGIMKADLSAFITADDVTDAESTGPLPSKRHDTPSAEVEDQLPPYSEEDPDVNTAACTITVKELSSMDTPTPTSDNSDNTFFALVTTTTHESTHSRPHTDMITRITSHFSTCSSENEEADAIQPAVASSAESDDLYDGPPASLHFAPPKLMRAPALQAKPRSCKTKHSHSAPPCPRSPSKVRRIVERFTSKKEDTAAKDKRRRARQAVV